jgi:hypothetical protein
VQGSFLATAVLENIAVKLDQLIVPGALVEVVNVLRDEGQLRYLFRESGQREVTRVRFHVGHRVAAPPVPAPDQRRVGEEGFRRGQIFGAVPSCASRKVGTPLSAETPAPVSTQT